MSRFDRSAGISLDRREELTGRLTAIGLRDEELASTLVDCFDLGYRDGLVGLRICPSSGVELLDACEREFVGLAAWLYADGHDAGSMLRCFREDCPELWDDR